MAEATQGRKLKHRPEMAEAVAAGETVKDVASRMGVSTATVGKACRLAGVKPRRPAPPRRRPTYDFSAADWRERDADIAARLGCTREWVRQVRHALVVGASPIKGRRTNLALTPKGGPPA